MATNPDTQRELLKAKLWLAEKIEASLADKTAVTRDPATLQLIAIGMNWRANMPASPFPPTEEAFFNGLVDEILGFGPMEALLNDKDITEVMVNRADLVYIERKGKVIETNVHLCQRRSCGTHHQQNHQALGRVGQPGHAAGRRPPARWLARQRRGAALRH
jgi:hypothetical protein